MIHDKMSQVTAERDVKRGESDGSSYRDDSRTRADA